VTTPDVPQDAPEPVPDDAGLPKDRPRSVGRKIVSGVLSYGVVVLAIWFLFKSLYGSKDEPVTLAPITVTQVVVICLLGVVNLATNLPPIVVALPGLLYKEAAVTNTASAALSNTVPEGGAVATSLNFAMLRSWGFALSDITSEVLVTGLWSQMTKYILLAISLVAWVIEGVAPPNTVWVAVGLSVLVVIAVYLLAMIIRSKAFAIKLGVWTDKLMRRLTKHIKRITPPDLEVELPRFRTLLVALLARCWQRLTVAMLFSQLFVCFVLGVACRMQGLGESTVSWATILVAYGAATFASLLVPTPGGLGVAEIVLVGVISYGLPASLQPAVLSAVILYRIATFLVPIPIGLVTYLYWRRSTAWRRPIDSRRITPLPGVVGPAL
jgi:putative heme transporter